MSDTLIIAFISFMGTILGSLFGVITANKLSNYRISQLEKKVERHNNLIERVYALEKHEAIVDEELAVVNHRIKDLENESA